VEQGIDQVTADHAGATGDENPHAVPRPATTGPGVSLHRINWVIDLLTPGRLALEKPYAVGECTT
jgi:hypothetical protein